MPLLQRLGQTPYWEQLPNAPNLEDLEEYVVEDIRPRDCQERNVVFLLESPHTQEVLRRHPLAGPSGTAVTNALAEVFHVRPDEQAWPLGEILTIHPREVARALDARLMRVGVMEVSELPMQLSPYRCDHKRQFGETLLRYLETIRKGPVSSADQVAEAPQLPARRSAGCAAVQTALVEDLQERIDEMGERAYFVPCGRIARVFLQEAAPCCDHFQDMVAHPSPTHQGWHAGALENVLRELLG